MAANSKKRKAGVALALCFIAVVLTPEGREGVLLLMELCINKGAGL